MTSEEFKKALQQVDWFYQYSDDRSTYVRGEETYQKVSRIANENLEFKKLFDEANPARINNN